MFTSLSGCVVAASAAHAAKLSVAAAHAFRREHEKLVAMKEKMEQLAANR